jgi:hypothetical protein
MCQATIDNCKTIAKQLGGGWLCLKQSGVYTLAPKPVFLVLLGASFLPVLMTWMLLGTFLVAGAVDLDVAWNLPPYFGRPLDAAWNLPPSFPLPLVLRRGSV